MAQPTMFENCQKCIIMKLNEPKLVKIGPTMKQKTKTFSYVSNYTPNVQGIFYAQKSKNIKQHWMFVNVLKSKKMYGKGTNGITIAN